MTIYTCYLCSKEHNSTNGLGKHLYFIHKDITKEEYAIRYMGETGKCISCNEPTRFNGLGSGFSKLCNKCGKKESWKTRDKEPLRELFKNNNPSQGRPKGSKNKNAYPINSPKVQERYSNNPPPSWKGKKHTKETRQKMSDSANEGFESGVRTPTGGYKTTMKGIYKPANPLKYKGDPTNIIYRSSYELKLFRYLDEHPEVDWWQSEEMFVPYRSIIDGKIHRYFPDVVFKKKGGKTTMIEVKPKFQTVPPDVSKSKTKSGKLRKSYITEVQTWGINQSKWEAARNYCKDRNWDFIIMTEYELGIK